MFLYLITIAISFNDLPYILTICLNLLTVADQSLKMSAFCKHAFSPLETKNGSHSTKTCAVTAVYPI